LHQYNKNNCREVFGEELVIREVKKHRVPQPRLGTRKLMIKLQDFVNGHHLKMGRDALFTLLREQDLLIRKRKRKVQATFSKHWLKKYPNLIRGYVPTAPNALWASDITYIVTSGGFAYLSLVTDAYSRKIVGSWLSGTLEATGSTKALAMALKGCKHTQDLIHHSDRGVQYCSRDYVKMLTKNGIKISMTENGDPLENAIAERVNGILKEELLRDKYDSFVAAQKDIAKAVTIYNSLRPHLSCDMLTPDVAHQKTGELVRKWKDYYKKTDEQMTANE
jgi:transposase InsO family protein